jgi:DNA-binding response OmpR family regulator
MILTMVQEWRPGAIVLDVKFSRIDVLDSLPILRRITEAPIIILGERGNTNECVRVLRDGADDYIAKPFEISELIARLHSALRRPRLERPSMLIYADLSIDLDRREVKRGTERIYLSAREYTLLLIFMRNPERVFSRDHLLDLVWGTARDVGQGTVEVYISYLRAKIDAHFEPKLIRTIRGAGYTCRLR